MKHEVIIFMLYASLGAMGYFLAEHMLLTYCS